MSKLEKGINDLETFCKQNSRLDLLEEWDYEKNGDLRPDNICYGTAKKVYWIAKCGHSWQASLNKRTSDKTGCPYCTESHAKFLQGFNDLATTNPELLPFWDYEKNGELLPSMVMKGQHRKVWWKGSCGHSWEATIYHRVQGRGCPICRKESRTSFQEQAIFYYISNAFSDAENGNTSVLGGKELDIYVPSQNIAIEFDGSNWHSSIKKDELKNKLCAEKGIKLYRIRDIECPALPYYPNVFIIPFEKYTDISLEKCIRSLLHSLDISLDVDIDRDRSSILNQFIAKKKEKSLAESSPELVEEWDFEKNGSLTPDLVSNMSLKKVWWMCYKGHEWQASISSRTNMKSGCPYCSGRKAIKGENDLATVCPDLAKEWDYKKNTIIPTEVSAGSTKKVWWIGKCGHSWDARIVNRAKGVGCPVCSGLRVLDGFNDLLTVDSKLVEEWDYRKNTVRPNEITKGYGGKIWWICEKGHSYDATISNRKQGKKCPYCSNHRVLSGYNDILSVAPELCPEWDYEDNDNKKPSEVLAGSNTKYWWKCENGHKWKTTVYSRMNGSKCPYCSGWANKAVKNLDTGEVFESLSDAAKSCGLKVGDTISLCCQGKQKKAGGYRWRYINIT